MSYVKEFENKIKAAKLGNDPEKLSNISNERLFELANDLAVITRKYYPQEHSNKEKSFSFVASSSLSGGIIPCSCTDCRLQRMASLASFASLYADEVYIFDPFEDIAIKDPKDFNDRDRINFFSGLIAFSLYKPLIENNIIKFAQSLISICKEHEKTISIPIAKQIHNRNDELYKIFEKHFLENCSLHLNKTPDVGYAQIEVRGPEDFIKHGVHYFLPTKKFKYINDIADNVKLPYKFSADEILTNDILSVLISPYLEDIAFQEWHSCFNGTSPIADNDVPFRIISKQRTTNNNPRTFHSAMKHNLPTVFSKDLNSVLKLRKEEHDAFRVYRDKINTMINKSGSWNEKELDEIFATQIKPEINILNKRINMIGN